MRNHDADFLRAIIRRWDAVIDQDGTLPDEVELKYRQGIKDREYRGLALFKIFADRSPAETLLMVVNAGSNPRTTQVPEAVLDPRSRAQHQLETLVSALGTALTIDQPPATGGHRPQVHVTIGFRDLLAQLGAAGTASQQFTDPVTPQEIRRVACDADLIPTVLGGHDEVLDLGRRRWLFSPVQRAALVARDDGCSFPERTIPASWWEAHHVDWWSSGGGTAINNGALLCSRHHLVSHQVRWKVQIAEGVPEFLPPPWIDPAQRPRQNLYFRI